MKRLQSEHPNQTKTPDKITVRVIKEFKREKRNGEDPYGNFIVWRIEQWTRQDKPCLAKRHVFITKNGKETSYKALGWSQEDMQWLADNWDEIQQLLQD